MEIQCKWQAFLATFNLCLDLLTGNLGRWGALAWTFAVCGLPLLESCSRSCPDWGSCSRTCGTRAGFSTVHMSRPACQQNPTTIPAIVGKRLPGLLVFDDRARRQLPPLLTASVLALRPHPHTDGLRQAGSFLFLLWPHPLPCLDTPHHISSIDHWSFATASW